MIIGGIDSVAGSVLDPRFVGPDRDHQVWAGVADERFDSAWTLVTGLRISGHDLVTGHHVTDRFLATVTSLGSMPPPKTHHSIKHEPTTKSRHQNDSQPSFLPVLIADHQLHAATRRCQTVTHPLREPGESRAHR